MSEERPAEVDSSSEIRCGVTRWYYKRMLLLTAMLVGMGSYFLYDGKWGYPKANKVVEHKQWFQDHVVTDFQKAKEKGEAEAAAWLTEARVKGWVVSSSLQEPRWDDYAAPHGWASDPKHYSVDEIEQQFWWGGTLLVGAVAAILTLLLNRNKTLKGYADHLVLPNGKTVRYADAFKVDKRKWDHKGLAYVFHKPGGQGAEQKAIIDDLKYDGAGKILDRLLANFSGELIEKVPDEEEEEEKESEDAQTDSSTQGEDTASTTEPK